MFFILQVQQLLAKQKTSILPERLPKAKSKTSNSRKKDYDTIAQVIVYLFNL